jgi:hypothetical protein
MQIEITANAIDQASKRVRALWLESRLTNDPEGEGLHSWLRRMAVPVMAKIGQRIELVKKLMAEK